MSEKIVRKQKKGRNKGKKARVESSISRDFILKVKEAAISLCEAEGFELIDVECLQKKAAQEILRIYIDKQGGVNLDDCAFIGRQLSDVLDIITEKNGTYNLEVSSPGIYRPLVKKEDFDVYSGRMAKIKIDPPVNNQNIFKGILDGMLGEDVKIIIDNNILHLPFQSIIKARLC